MRTHKKWRFRLLSVLLVLSMAVGIMPTAAFAAQETGTEATSKNVAIVQSYAAQMMNANQKSDYTAGKFSWDTEDKPDSWRYFNGVMFDAFMMVGGGEMTNYVDTVLSANIGSEGTPTNYHAGELDSVPMALALFDLLDTSDNAEKYKLAIQYIYTQLEGQTSYSNCGGNYLHKQDTSGDPTKNWSTWNIGLDGLYMAQPFLMECAKAIDSGKLTLEDKSGSAVTSESIYAAVYNRFAWVAENMYDSTTGLYHHGWNVNSNEGNGHFWGRGIGWYAVALVDVIDMMPTTYQTQMTSYLTKLFDGMLNYQDADTGMWYNVVNRRTDLDKNILETSVSSMMAYALMKAYNQGFVTDAKYGKAGLAAFNGVVSNKVTGNEGSYRVKDTYLKSGVGTTDSYYTGNGYTEDEAKGTGALIMACTVANAAAKKLSESTIPDPTDPSVPETSEPAPTEPGTVEDKDTGITVSGSGATAITVADKSSDSTVAVALADKLESGFMAYDITLTGYTQGTKATVTMPAPEGANKVYYVAEDSTLEEIAGASFADGKVTFTTNHFSTYAVGKAKTTSDEGDVTKKNWKDLPATGETSDTYTQVTSMDTNNADGYLICRTKNDYLLAYNPETAVTGLETTRGESSSDGYTFTNTSDETYWYLDNSNHIYCTVNGTNYYLNVTSSGGGYSLGLTNNSSSASAWTISQSPSSSDVTISTNANSKTVSLKYDSNSFSVGTNNKNTLSLYRRTPGTPTSSGGQAALAGTLTYTVTVGGILTESNIKEAAAVYYRASEDDAEEVVAWTDSKVTTSWNNELNTNTAGTYTMTVKYSGTELGTITVTVEEKQITGDVLTGNDPVTTKKGVEPGFSNIKLTVTYKDGTTAEITTENGLIISGYNKDTIGIYYAKISYQGKDYGTVKVTVEGNPYDGLEEATEYPEYPADGAVRIDKTATGQDFNSTGVVKVELDAAGISVKQGVDVVLVVDVSNSMGWTDNWFEGMTEAEVKAAKDNVKIPDGTADETTDKLDMAMQAAQEFTDILLADNKARAESYNSISFVTFAGADRDNGGSTDYIDSVQTVFTNVLDAESAKTAFRNTKFIDYSTSGTKVTYTLQIGDSNGGTTSGTNRGNTNYDYAFGEANAAVASLKKPYGGADGYAARGRQTVVVFMTDGAPSHYNDERANGSAADKLYGQSETYPTEDGTDWLLKMSEPNTYAQTLNSNIDAFYAVGFDLNHGGFSDYSWTQDELKPVLEDLAGENSVKVELAENGDVLKAFYNSLAHQIKFAGTNARATDTIGSDFTLQTTGFGTASTPSNITVTAYYLYTKADNVDNSLIGTRTGESTELETVTFSADGTQAYSSVLGDTKNIMTTDTEGNVTIEAQYFTYTKDVVTGEEKFVWTIGNFTDKEVALSFYAYLKGSMEGNCEKGVYYTNNGATLEYVDINGKHASKHFPDPTVSWGSAITQIEYYLVNDKGEPVNNAGNVIPFANRIKVGTTGVRTFNWNESLTVNGNGYVPAGYDMYNPVARYMVTAGSHGSGSLTIDDIKVISGTEEITTKRVDTNASFADTTVAFGVLFKGVPQVKDPLEKDQIVMDYGKAIQVDVVTEYDTVENGFKIDSVVGFLQYDEAKNVEQTQFTSGTATFNGDYGQFTIVDGKVKYQPKKMLSAVEKIFVVVKVVSEINASDYYYMLNELDIIPATVMYYETDFADGVFTLTNGTTKEWHIMIMQDTVENKSDEIQNDGTIGVNQTYGFDSTYADDANYSNGSSLKIEGEKFGSGYTSASFSFTGTGFDIISRTGDAQGLIQVKIFAKGATEPTKKVSVLNKSESELELYQIPVVSVNNLAYGAYDVTIEVYPAVNSYTGNLASLNRGGEFHFDALRIYDPINVYAETSDASIAQAAYEADGEANNAIIEVRQKIIDAKTYDDGSGLVENSVVFVDRTPNAVGVKDYTTIGPNNEVYLSYGQGIAFKLTSTEAPASIDIGAKSADGNPVTLSATLYSMDDNYDASISVDITSSTALFYDLMAEAVCTTSEILSGDGAYVCIFNDGDGILSITDLKVAYGNQPGIATFSVDKGAVQAANKALTKEKTDEPNYDILSASFDTATCKLRKKATMTVVTTDDVQSLQVTDKKGKQVKADITSTTENGQTTWKVSIQMTVGGKQTYTVTGYGANGTPGTPASATINVTRK